MNILRFAILCGYFWESTLNWTILVGHVTCKVFKSKCTELEYVLECV